MAVLRTAMLLATAATGCYAPDLRDCTVSCRGLGDCAADQVCGGDGLCASPGIAGRCRDPADAGPDASGPPGPDAAAPPDAAPDAPPELVELRVEIAGDHDAAGEVEVAGVGSCDADGHHTTCVFAVPAGPLALIALPDPEARFHEWKSGGCEGQDATCDTLALPPATIVEARFKRDKHDDDDDDDDVAGP